jgi:hypothetical protein
LAARGIAREGRGDVAEKIPIEGLQAIRQAEEQRRLDGEMALNRWRLAKQTVWLALLTCAFLMFYLIDVMQQSMILLAMRY